MRPDSCWIGLLALNVRHLAERMFFAGYAKEKHAERNSDDALAKEASHNALPQLSVSGVARKDESVGMRSHRSYGLSRSTAVRGTPLTRGYPERSEGSRTDWLSTLFSLRVLSSNCEVRRCARDDTRVGSAEMYKR